MKVGMLSLILVGALLLTVNPEQAESAQRNGFSIEDPLVPLEDILSGGRRVTGFLPLIPPSSFPPQR